MFEKKAKQKDLTEWVKSFNDQLIGIDQQIKKIQTDHQTHLVRFEELKRWVVEYCIEMKNKPADLTQIINRITDIEGSQKTLNALLITHEPVTKNPKLTPLARKIKDLRNVR